jgi:hypothetical protein
VKNLVFLLLLSTGFSIPLTVQKLASFEVDMTNHSILLTEPIQIGLDAITQLPDSVLTFTEVRGNKSIAVPFQIDQGQQRCLHWMIACEPKGPAKRIFELTKTTSRSTSTNSVSFAKQDGALILKSNEKISCNTIIRNLCASGPRTSTTAATCLPISIRRKIATGFWNPEKIMY